MEDVDVFFVHAQIDEMPWNDVEVFGYYSPFTLDTRKIYEAKTCPKLSPCRDFSGAED